MISFECVEGLCKGQVFEFASGIVVLGRSPDCDVWLDDSTCSRRHAGISVRDGNFVIADMGSTNGMLVNGQRLKEAILQQGDRFCIGKNVFVFLSSQSLDTRGYDAGVDEIINNTVAFDDAESRLLDAVRLAEETANTNNAELESLRRANKNMRAVYSLGRAIASTLELRDLYKVIVECVLENFELVERVCIFLVNRDTGEFTKVKAQSRTETEEFPVSRDVLERVRSSQLGILASDVLTEEGTEQSQTLFDSRVRSLMCVPLNTRDVTHGALYVENWTQPNCFGERDLELLTVFGNQMAMAIENASLYQELERSFYETVRSLSKALEAKDKYTRGHSGRVAFYAVGIGRRMGLDEKELENLKVAAELHDIGKIGLPEHIITGARALTDEEYEIVKKHPDHGVEILKPIRFLQDALPIVRHHHERYNGKGYPSGFKGQDIPLGARILNLADAFDAMTTKRPYNHPKTFAEALEQCRSEAGVSFDGNCVEALCEYIHERFAKTPQRLHSVAGEQTLQEHVLAKPTPSEVVRVTNAMVGASAELVDEESGEVKPDPDKTFFTRSPKRKPELSR